MYFLETFSQWMKEMTVEKEREKGKCDPMHTNWMVSWQRKWRPFQNKDEIRSKKICVHYCTRATAIAIPPNKRNRILKTGMKRNQSKRKTLLCSSKALIFNHLRKNNTRARTRTHTRTRRHTNTHAHAHTNTHTHARTHTHMRTHTHAHTHARAHTRAHAHIHTHTRLHIHTHTLTQHTNTHSHTCIYIHT